MASMSNFMKFARRGLAVPTTVHSGCISISGAAQPPPVQQQTAGLAVMGPERFLFVPILLVCLSLCTGAQSPWSGVLSTSRAVDWAQAGIPGGIPSGSWTQCGSTIAAYSGTAAAINNALAACGVDQYVLLGAGTFNLSTGITFGSKSNTLLRGSGANATFLVFTGGVSCWQGGEQALICVQSSDGTYPGGNPPARNWTAGYAKGTNSVTLANTTGITTNSTMIVLDQCNTGYSGSPCAGTPVDNGNFFACNDKFDGTNGCAAEGPDATFARPARFEWEIVEATAVNSSTGVVTITPPLEHPNWAAGQTPQAWLIQTIRNSGVENLSIDGTNAGSGVIAGVGFFDSAYCWAKGVRFANLTPYGIWTWTGIHMQYEQNYFYNIGLSGGSAVDSFGIRMSGSNDLVQNNILQNIRVSVLNEGPGNGDVFSYNFSIFQNGGTDFMWEGFRPHSQGDDFQLYEGNVANTYDDEVHHGTHNMNTSFRGFYTGWESCANTSCAGVGHKNTATWAIEVDSYNRYANLIANVAGTPGVDTAYLDSNQTNFSVIEVGGNGGASPAIPTDPLVASTMLRWGNYDTVTGAARWCGSLLNTGWATICGGKSEVPSAIGLFPNLLPILGDILVGQASLPPSFYLSSKPSWFGSIPWPAIGPDVSGGNVGMCSGTINTPGEFAGVPATSSSQCTGTSLTTAWGGHVNAIPAMACYLSMGGLPDGTGPELTFNPAACYGGGSVGSGPPPPAPNPPTNLNAVVQ